MSDEDDNKLPINGFYIEIGSHEEGELYFGASEDFFNDADEEFKDWMRNLLYGLYFAVSALPDELLSYGAALRRQDDFEEFARKSDDKTHYTDNIFQFPVFEKTEPDDDDTVH